MHPTITQLLIQTHQHELEVDAARVRIVAAAKPAGPQRRHTIFSPAAIGMAVLLLAVSLLAACGGSSTTTTRSTMPANGSLDAARLFAGACASCHGPLGEGGPSGVSLTATTATDRQLIIDTIRHGTGAMPASSGGMNDDQVKALADYVAGLR